MEIISLLIKPMFYISSVLLFLAMIYIFCLFRFSKYHNTSNNQQNIAKKNPFVKPWRLLSFIQIGNYIKNIKNICKGAPDHNNNSKRLTDIHPANHSIGKSDESTKRDPNRRIAFDKPRVTWYYLDAPK